jgi:hypothetical protein
VRAGCGQAGQAAAHFCARLNAFKRLTPLLCNSNEGSAFAHHAHCASSRPFSILTRAEQALAGLKNIQYMCF